MGTTLLLLVGRVIVGIGQLLILKQLTGYLPPTEMGIYYMAMALVAVASVAVLSPVGQFIGRALLSWNQQGLARGPLLQLSAFAVLVGLLLAGGAHLMKDAFLGGHGGATMAFAIGAITAGTALAGIALELTNILGHRLKFVLLGCLDVGGKLGILTIVGYFGAPDAVHVLVSLGAWSLVMAAVVCGILFTQLRKSTRAAALADPVSSVFAFCWPLALASMLYWSQSNGYRMALESQADLAAVGRFSIGFGLGASIMAAIETLFGQIFVPRYIKERSALSEHTRRCAWSRYVSTAIHTQVPIGLYIAASAPFLCVWFVAPEYRDTFGIAAMGVIVQVIRGLTVAVYNGLVQEGATKLVVLPNAVAAVVALGGTFAAGQISPIWGTGLSLIAAGLCSLVGLCLCARNVAGIHLPIRVILRCALMGTPLCIAVIVCAYMGLAINPMSNLLIIFLTSGLLAMQQFDLWRKAD